MTEGRKTLIILVVFFVLIGSWSLIYHNVYDQKMTELAESIVKEEQAIDMMRKQIEKALEEKAAKPEDYYLYIPKDSGIANVLDYLSKTAEKNKVSMGYAIIDNQASSPSEGAVVNGLSTLSVNTSIDGNYANVRAFLKEVHSGERLLNLTNWQWVNIDETDINISLSYEAYYYSNNYEEFLELPVIPAYKPADRINPINKL